jgi:hypothetical protein
MLKILDLQGFLFPLRKQQELASSKESSKINGLERM